MGNNYIKYDTDKMAETKRVYNECVTAMDKLQINMQVVVDEVKDAWQSEAGEAFFEKYDNEWLQGFVQYKEVLAHMAENIDTSKNKYSEITRQANALKIK